jgi:hypothetical protein
MSMFLSANRDPGKGIPAPAGPGLGSAFGTQFSAPNTAQKESGVGATSTATNANPAPSKIQVHRNSTSAPSSTIGGRGTLLGSNAEAPPPAAAHRRGSGAGTKEAPAASGSLSLQAASTKTSPTGPVESKPPAPPTLLPIAFTEEGIRLGEQSMTDTMKTFHRLLDVHQTLDGMLLWEHLLNESEATLSNVEKLIGEAEENLTRTETSIQALAGDSSLLRPGSAVVTPLHPTTRDLWARKGDDFRDCLTEQAERLMYLEINLERKQRREEEEEITRARLATPTPHCTPLRLEMGSPPEESKPTDPAPSSK